MKLTSKESYYMIVSSTSTLNDEYTNKVYTSRLEDALYLKEYDIFKMGSNQEDISFIAYKTVESKDLNNELRYDTIELMDSFNCDSIIVKYYDETTIKKVMKSGAERSIDILPFDGSESSYYTEGFSFSLKERDEYFIPNKMNDFKEDMLIEIKNDKNIWIAKTVKDVESEWNKMYKLLCKYERVRGIKKLY
jgi:hypothetical protein